MFTGTIHTVKWFFMKQTLHSMLACYFFQCFHNQLVMVNCNVCFCIDRCQLVLCRCYFVMLCLCRNTQFPEFFIYFFHKTGNSLADNSKIMIIQLLTFWRHGSKERSSGKDKVFSFFVIDVVKYCFFAIWRIRIAGIGNTPFQKTRAVEKKNAPRSSLLPIFDQIGSPRTA